VPPAEGSALAELQRLFFAFVTAPEGVGKELETRGLPPEAVTAIIASDARASAVDRLDVYANMYFFRILDVLRADYPKVAAVLGDAVFHNLATDYLPAHPSRHPSLRFVGAALPGFLGGHAVARDRPWLPELAALEWARVDVFDRADTPTQTREALATVAPEAFAEIPLRTVAACALVPATHAVEETWRAVEAAGDADTETEARPHEPPRLADPTHAVLVWRRGVSVQHRTIVGPERRALDALRAGTTFGALCAALADESESEEAAARLAVQLLGQWLADELLARV
jgi:hypothetical protein